jgi:hypothetical protein
MSLRSQHDLAELRRERALSEASARNGGGSRLDAVLRTSAARGGSSLSGSRKLPRSHQRHSLAKVLAAHGPRLTGGSFDHNKIPRDVQSQAQAQARARARAQAEAREEAQAQPQAPFRMSMRFYTTDSVYHTLELDVNNWDFAYRDVRLFTSADKDNPRAIIEMDRRIPGGFQLLLPRPNGRIGRDFLTYKLVEMGASEAFLEFFRATIGALVLQGEGE